MVAVATKNSLEIVNKMNTEEQAEEKKEFPTDERGWTRIGARFFGFSRPGRKSCHG